MEKEIVVSEPEVARQRRASGTFSRRIPELMTRRTLRCSPES